MMKTKILVRLIVIIFIGIFISCGILDEDDDYFNGTMQAKVNDELVIFDEVYGERVLTWYWEWTGIQRIIGKKDLNMSGAIISINFVFNPARGRSYHPDCIYTTWTENDNNHIPTTYYTKCMPETSHGTEFSSTVVFTSITNKMYKGTFSFTAYDDLQNPTDSAIVTDGVFEIDSDGKKW